jgi:hypothetical protein
MNKHRATPLSPDGLKTFSLYQRKSKVQIKDFGKVSSPSLSLAEFIPNLPDFLAAKDFKELLSLMKKAKTRRKSIIWALGAHVIKVGLSPILIDLMKEGWVTALALNGAGIIHDFEIALCGQTSEDVEVQIQQGAFGMAKETGEMLNKAINAGARAGKGLGEAVGQMMVASRLPHKNLSLCAAADELDIPVTVHIALGTDVIHFHPEADGEAMGKASLRDFFLFCSLVEKLGGGGIYLNIGSAVILPEVFLKALSFVRNKGKRIENFSTAVFDFIHHYRPYQNVVRRPVGEKGRGFYFIGHHELMIPLLAAGLKAL